MINVIQLKNYFGRSSTLALIYAIAIVVLFLTTVASLTQVIHLYQERNSKLMLLKELELRARSYSSNPNHGSLSDTDPLFLSGNSATLASAGLLQRVTGAITSAGGKVLSSEAGDQTARSKNGELKATINFEITQVNLQKLLYDLESGSPFLFINQIDIQAKKLPDAAGIRLAVVMQVAGIWRGQK